MIAITGAAGFIGFSLAHRLGSLGHELLPSQASSGRWPPCQTRWPVPILMGHPGRFDYRFPALALTVLRWKAAR